MVLWCQHFNIMLCIVWYGLPVPVFFKLCTALASDVKF